MPRESEKGEDGGTEMSAEQEGRRETSTRRRTRIRGRESRKSVNVRSKVKKQGWR